MRKQIKVAHQCCRALKVLAKNQPSYKGEKQMSNKEKILELYFHEGLKQVEIAKILNISPNAMMRM